MVMQRYPAVFHFRKKQFEDSVAACSKCSGFSYLLCCSMVLALESLRVIGARPCHSEGAVVDKGWMSVVHWLQLVPSVV